MASRPTSRMLSFAAWLAGRLPSAGLRALYRLGPLSSLLRFVLNRSAPAGLSEVTVASGRLAGARMLLDLRIEKDHWLGAYEPFTLDAIAHYLRPGMTAYDVGAHIGYVTLYLARVVGPTGRVVAFEPLPANRERLRENLRLNGAPAWVQLVPAAVGEASGTQLFRPSASASMGMLLGSAQQHEMAQTDIQVQVLALDEFAAGPELSPDLVKMDIEGGELAALRGMRRLLRQAGPIVLLELHDAQGANAKNVLDEFREAGYEVRRLAPRYPVIASTAGLGRKAYLFGLPPGGRPPMEGA